MRKTKKNAAVVTETLIDQAIAAIPELAGPVETLETLEAEVHEDEGETDLDGDMNAGDVDEEPSDEDQAPAEDEQSDGPQATLEELIAVELTDHDAIEATKTV
ncbi:hypothetical protein NKH72_21635, partial [Mesorhizobium sp. M0955]|uniref:hypothetical protein n=1 Tax=Mesorhizobium sp. M0955 TaxID=2957033 RepID=UPI00333AFB90